VTKSTPDTAATLAASGFATAKTLAEALPFIQIYDRETVVIKYGGHAMGDVETARRFAADVVRKYHRGANVTLFLAYGPMTDSYEGNVRNVTAGSLSEAIVLRYAVIKSSNA
jgi:acetylglutamate kinase